MDPFGIRVVGCNVHCNQAHLDLFHREVDLGHLEPSLKTLWAEVNTNLGQLEGIFKVFTLDKGLSLLEQEWDQVWEFTDSFR